MQNTKGYHGTKTINEVYLEPNQKMYYVEIHNSECDAIAFALGKHMYECADNAQLIINALREYDNNH